MLRPRWDIAFHKTGVVIFCDQCNNMFEFKRELNVCNECINGNMRIFVEANDRDSAIKIASEIRAKYLAEKMGL